jgi:MFS family permease
VSRAFVPLRDVAFRRLLAGQLTSGIGDAFYTVALPWYILATHGGALLLGTVLAIYGTSRTVVLAVGGHASDRWRPWTVMLGADLVRAVALVAFAVAAATSRPSLVLLAPIAVVLGIGAGMFIPASGAIVPTLLADEQLQAGNALSAGGQQLSGLLGPAIGGPIVALLGSSVAFSVDAVTFVVSVLSLIGVLRVLRARALESAARPADEQKQGLVSLVRERPVLLTVFLTLVVANLVLGGLFEVGLAALVHGPLHAGASGYGALVAVTSAGALGGTLFAARFDGLARPAVVASLIYLVSAALCAIVPYLGGAIGAGVLLCAFGAAIGAGNVITDTMLMRWTPKRLLGRVMGFLSLGSFGVYPVSAILAGLVVHSLGAAILFPLAGATLGLAVLGALTRPSWRQLGARAPDAAAGKVVRAETEQGSPRSPMPPVPPTQGAV